jgi:hypothetical protein
MCSGEYVDISVALETIEQAYKELLANAEKFKAYSNNLINSDRSDERSKVSLNTYRQVVWERNLAIDQLKELGYGFGESMDNAVSRDTVKAIKQVVDDYFLVGKKTGYDCMEEIDRLINPTKKA